MFYLTVNILDLFTPSLQFLYFLFVSMKCLKKIEENKTFFLFMVPYCQMALYRVLCLCQSSVLFRLLLLWFNILIFCFIRNLYLTCVLCLTCIVESALSGPFSELRYKCLVRYVLFVKKKKKNWGKKMEVQEGWNGQAGIGGGLCS